MNKELIINVTPHEVVIALLQDKKLVELSREEGSNQFAVGDIYLGKVKKIMPGLNAAFVDVGYEKDAFLHYLDLGPQLSSLDTFTRQIINQKTEISLANFVLEEEISKDGKITDVISSTQPIVVQIAKEPISTKGPKLTCEIAIAGRYMVLMPFSNKVSVSQKIKDLDERNRLKEMVRPVLPTNFGVIIRTVAENKTVDEISSDLEELINKWKNCFENIQKSTPPTRLLGELSRTSALLRDLLNDSFQGIYVNDTDLYNDIKEYITTISPEQEKIVKLHNTKDDIFDYHKVTKQIKSLFGRTVSIDNGGYLIIERTEAMHVVDVNTGPRQSDNNQEKNALETNLDAATEIARQLRLRDLGGIIVVDFIDMTSAENRNLLFERLKEAMKQDRAKHTILPPSRFGLIEITRQRVRPEMVIQTNEKCPTCLGTGEIQASLLLLDEIENNIRYILKEQNEPKLTLIVHPFLESYIKKGWIFSNLQWQWYKKFKKWIPVRSSGNYSLLQYSFYNQHEEEIKI